MFAKECIHGSVGKQLTGGARPVVRKSLSRFGICVLLWWRSLVEERHVYLQKKTKNAGHVGLRFSG